MPEPVKSFFGDIYDNEADYQKAVAEHNARAAVGPPGPGPARSVRLINEVKVSAAGATPVIQNAEAYQALVRSGANTPNRANPYNTQVADQSRAAQLALMQQMQRQAAGPSLAGMQGQRAMGQMGQQAIGQAAMGNSRGAMLGAAQGAGGLAGDVGQARLSELMRMQAGSGAAASGLRANDLRSADAQSSSGLQMRGLDDASKKFYASQGAGLQASQDRAYLEHFKLLQRQALEDKKRQDQAVSNALSMTASSVAPK